MDQLISFYFYAGYSATGLNDPDNGTGAFWGRAGPLGPPRDRVGVGFHTDAMSPMWKSATTFGGISDPALQQGRLPQLSSPSSRPPSG